MVPNPRPATNPRTTARARCSRRGGSTRSAATTDRDDLGTVAAHKTHRQHAVIEQLHADLKNSALAHLTSGRFTANAAWLVCAVMAFSLTRAAGTLTGDPKLTRATTGTLRRTIVSVPARVASSARRLTLHLPQNWPRETAWRNLFDNTFGRTQPILAQRPRHLPGLDAKASVEQPDTRGRPLNHAHTPGHATQRTRSDQASEGVHPCLRSLPSECRTRYAVQVLLEDRNGIVIGNGSAVADVAFPSMPSYHHRRV
ncbi:putative transposase [Rhodococcus opacus B4]|uniref:Putative transposase n=1 Tax=Rhodococcus opacus (strain B4) TaxID=632772 RepID=C1B4Y2_RHOOB|nr:putative transposase [Rhodococcus opacus B4]